MLIHLQRAWVAYNGEIAWSQVGKGADRGWWFVAEIEVEPSPWLVRTREVVESNLEREAPQCTLVTRTG